MRALLAVAALGLAGTATAATLPPRDDCLRLDGYFSLRQELEAAVKARDAARLLALASDTIEWSFGNEPGKAGFAKAWKLDSGDGRASPIWAELDRILPLGCGIEQGGFALPWLYTAEFTPPNGADPFSASVVVGNGVALRQAAANDGAVLARLSWELVERLVDGDPAGWVKVRTAGGQTGFVRKDYIRSSTDHRAGFTRREGRWQMSFFVAGD